MLYSALKLVPILDGITMGGGAAISIAGTFRIATSLMIAAIPNIIGWLCISGNPKKSPWRLAIGTCALQLIRIGGDGCGPVAVMTRRCKWKQWLCCWWWRWMVLLEVIVVLEKAAAVGGALGVYFCFVNEEAKEFV
ncbi:hypothetical protein L1987_35800 [Smallanthus sonchifolius]|uniref:Uncharacterized protein n=1 Tax=Smallanthus sonchifolius TaxID=185202 RepID=A0ACB9HBT3_9ASTR|nr:hypothetical protein L1987_35800 [Smallanthus sonchifolius]